MPKFISSINWPSNIGMWEMSQHVAEDCNLFIYLVSCIIYIPYSYCILESQARVQK